MGLAIGIGIAALYSLVSGAAFGFSYVTSMRGAWDWYDRNKGFTSAETAARAYDSMTSDYNEIANYIASSREEFFNYLTLKKVFGMMASGNGGYWRQDVVNPHQEYYFDTGVHEVWVWQGISVTDIKQQVIAQVLSIWADKLAARFPTGFEARIGDYPEYPIRPADYVVSPPSVRDVEEYQDVFYPDPVDEFVEPTESIQTYYLMGQYDKAVTAARNGVSQGWYSQRDLDNLIASIAAKRSGMDVAIDTFTMTPSFTVPPVAVPTSQDVYQEEYYKSKLDELQNPIVPHVMTAQERYMEQYYLAKLAEFEQYGLAGKPDPYKPLSEYELYVQQFQMDRMERERLAWEEEELPDDDIDVFEVNEMVEQYLSDKFGLWIDSEDDFMTTSDYYGE